MDRHLAPLYQEERRGVERWFRSRGLRDDAADLAQECFLRVARCPHPGHTVLWVIAKHLAIDEHRRRRLSTVPLELVGDIPTYAQDPARVCERNDALRCLFTALRGLPPSQRSAWFLHHGLGLTCAEAGRALDLTEGATRALVHRATVNLRRRLREDDAA